MPNMDRFDWLELGRARDAGEADAARQAPTDSRSSYANARSMRRGGHFSAAADYYQRAVQFDPNNYSAWVELTDCLVRADDIERADKASAQALEQYRQVRPFYAARALVLARMNRPEEAARHSDISVDGGDRSWYARAVRGELVLLVHRVERQKALQMFEQAANLAESPWEPLWMGAWCFLKAGWPAYAGGLAAEACHADPRAPVCWLALADSFRALRLYDQALFYYERAIELEPANEAAAEGAKHCRGSVFGLMRLFRRERLLERWRKAVERDVGDRNGG